MLRRYLELTKPRITAMILISAAIGFWFGAPGGFPMTRLLEALIGIGLMASGTAALNQWYEREADGRMRRTMNRPLPSGRISARAALAFGLAVSAIGFGELAFALNWLSAALGLFTLLSYLVLYTPMKQRSPVCTTIGAIPGAMPPIIGFAAAHGSLTPQAWALAAILFLWQFPHFYAIAWMYKDDYGRGGIRMLPVVEPDCRSTARRMALFGLAMIPAGVIPSAMGMTSPIYAVGACALGVWYAASAMRAARERTTARARAVLLTSVAYLPLLYGLMIVDRVL